MRQKTQSSNTRPGNKPAGAAAGRTIPEQSGCGPNVDTWPILDLEGLELEAKASGDGQEPDKSRSRN